MSILGWMHGVRNRDSSFISGDIDSNYFVMIKMDLLSNVPHTTTWRFSCSGRSKKIGQKEAASYGHDDAACQMRLVDVKGKPAGFCIGAALLALSSMSVICMVVGLLGLPVGETMPKGHGQQMGSSKKVVSMSREVIVGHK